MMVVAYLAQSNFSNQYCLVVKRDLWNKYHWSLNIDEGALTLTKFSMEGILQAGQTTTKTNKLIRDGQPESMWLNAHCFDNGIFNTKQRAT